MTLADVEKRLLFSSLFCLFYYPMPSGIAVFDFDWYNDFNTAKQQQVKLSPHRSLIEEDSDYWTIHSLSPEIWVEVAQNEKSMQWTDLM